MNLALFWAFLLATLAIVGTPGPSVALASGQALRFGPRAAVMTVLGDALGSAVHIAVVTLGLRLLLPVAGAVLPWLQIGGGGYLVWLGLRAVSAAGDGAPVPNARHAFFSGFVACVTNPKAIVFFFAFFPAFIDPAYSVVVQSLIYGGVFILLDAAFILGYAWAAVTLFRHSFGGQARFERLSGAVLIALGLLLMVKGGAEAL